VRISPYEIHINDPEFIDQIQPGSTVQTYKYGWAQRFFGIRSAGFTTESHDLHRIRRAAISPYFSKTSLLRLEPGIQSILDTLIYRLEGLKGSGKPVNFYHVFASLTADVIGQYAFAQTFGFLDHPDFSPHWQQSIMDISSNGHLLKQFGWIQPLTEAMPLWLVKIVSPKVMLLLELRENMLKHILRIKASIARGEQPEGQTTIFYDVLSNPQVRPQEKTDDYLQDEAQTLIGAGTATTAAILTIVTFHLLSKPHIVQKLQAELKSLVTRIDGPPKWQQLEQLPYLTAIITEACRIGYGIPHRSARKFPDLELRYGDYRIPKMTPVSMSTVILHDNPTLFPAPRTFVPERFLEQPHLKKYLNHFARGTRQCVGLNLAYAELYMTLAAVFWPGRFELELFETDQSDVETVHDFFNTSPRLDSKGMRVLIN